MSYPRWITVTISMIMFLSIQAQNKHMTNWSLSIAPQNWSFGMLSSSMPAQRFNVVLRNNVAPSFAITASRKYRQFEFGTGISSNVFSNTLEFEYLPPNPDPRTGRVSELAEMHQADELHRFYQVAAGIHLNGIFHFKSSEWGVNMSLSYIVIQNDREENSFFQKNFIVLEGMGNSSIWRTSISKEFYETNPFRLSLGLRYLYHFSDKFGLGISGSVWNVFGLKDRLLNIEVRSDEKFDIEIPQNIPVLADIELYTPILQVGFVLQYRFYCK